MRKVALKIRLSRNYWTETGAQVRRVVMWWLISANLLGCAAAYNARTDLAPDERHAVRCFIRGAWGRSYYRETRKRVVVSIYSRGPNDSRLLQQDLEQSLSNRVAVAHPIPGLETKLVFQRRYRFEGSDVDWYSIWAPDSGVSIVFYDYGRDVALPYDAMKSAQKRVLLQLNFAYNPATGSYVEVNAPSK